jgi:hypothetical protein
MAPLQTLGSRNLLWNPITTQCVFGTEDIFMHVNPGHARAFTLAAIFLPIGLFAAYVTYLVVPEVVRVVVPTVVQSLVAE